MVHRLGYVEIGFLALHPPSPHPCHYSCTTAGFPRSAGGDSNAGGRISSALATKADAGNLDVADAGALGRAGSNARASKKSSRRKLPPVEGR